jgi:hypothetical protein
MVGGGQTPILAAGFNDVAATFGVSIPQVALTTGMLCALYFVLSLSWLQLRRQSSVVALRRHVQGSRPQAYDSTDAAPALSFLRNAHAHNRVRALS